MIRVRSKARIVHALDFRMLFQKSRDGHSVFALALDAHAERLDAPNEQIRRAGIHRAAKIDNQLADAFHPVFAADGNSRDDIGMARERLCGAVQDHVVAQRDGILQHGGCKRIVDERDQLVLLGESHGLVDVHKAQRRIRWRLNIEGLGACVNQLFDSVEIRLHVVHGNTHVRKNVAHQPISAAIKLRRGNQFVSGFQHCQERRRNRRHPGSCHDGCFRSFKRGDFLLGDRQGRIAIAGVDVALALAFCPLLHFLRVGKREAGRADNFRNDGAIHAVAYGFAGMNGFGLRAQAGILLGVHEKECALFPLKKTRSKLACRELPLLRRPRRFLASDLQEQLTAVHPQQHEPIAQQNRGAAEERLQS